MYSQSRGRAPLRSARALATAFLLAALLTLPAAPAQAAYPGVNGTIAFERGSDIWVVQPDGTGLRNVTNTMTFDERDPVVSPDGTRVAFTRRDIYDEIWAVGVDGTGLTEVSNPIGHEVLGSAEHPTWSPDGTAVAFQGFHSTEGANVIWVAAADGAGGAPLTTGYTAERPNWGVGGEIAAEAPPGRIVAIDPATGQERLLLRSEDAPDRYRSIGYPEWGPDGTRLLFSCDDHDICEVDAAGGGWRYLTPEDEGGAIALQPQYSPDGQQVLFHGTQPTSDFGDFDVFTIPVEGIADGGTATAVTSGLAIDRDADWGPAAGAVVPEPQPEPDPQPQPQPGPPGAVVEPFDGDPATTTVIERGEPVAAAIDISRARFVGTRAFAQPGPEAEWVVLSRDDDFPDSLAGAALTGLGPMLFTDRQELTPSTHQEIQRVLPAGGRVYLLGGTGAISQGIEDQLRAEGYEVRRLSGPSRVETAVAVATEVRTQFEDNGLVLLARSTAPADNPTAGWADSVSGGAIAAYGAVPILVTPSSAVHEAVAGWLATDGPQRTVLLGGTAALSEAVESAVPNGLRVAGPDRTATATAIAAALWPEEEGQEYVVVNGFHPQGWAFGLAAAGIAADAEAPLLLVGPQVSPATATAVSACGAPAVDLLLVGDSTVIQPAVAAELDRLDGEGCGGDGTAGGGGSGSAGGGGTGGDSGPGSAPPPSGAGGQGGRWAAEPHSGVVELEFTFDGANITAIEGTLLWYCDGNYVSEYVTFFPEQQSIAVTDGSWTYDHEFTDDTGTNTYHEHFSGTFTSPTSASGVVEYEFAGNGYYCDSGEIEWTASPA